MGHAAEAVPSFLEAADADPTLEHLAHAADAVRDQDPVRARNLAMEALRLLGEEEKGQSPLAEFPRGSRGAPIRGHLKTTGNDKGCQKAAFPAIGGVRCA